MIVALPIQLRRYVPRLLSAMAFFTFLGMCALAWSQPGTKTAEADLRHAIELLDSWHSDPAPLEAARALLDRALAVDPKSASAHREYCRYHIMRGAKGGNRQSSSSLLAAEISLNAALRLNPRYAEAYVLAGHLYYLQRRYEDAKTALRTAEGIGTKDVWLPYNWGSILMAGGDLEGAARKFQVVITSLHWAS